MCDLSIMHPIDSMQCIGERIVDKVGGVISSVFSTIFGGIVKWLTGLITDAVAWMLKTLGTFWVNIKTPSIGSTDNVPSDTIGWMWAHLGYYTFLLLDVVDPARSGTDDDRPPRRTRCGHHEVGRNVRAGVLDGPGGDVGADRRIGRLLPLDHPAGHRARFLHRHRQHAELLGGYRQRRGRIHHHYHHRPGIGDCFAHSGRFDGDALRDVGAADFCAAVGGDSNEYRNGKAVV